MRKPKEIEEMIKRAIRDELALHPLKSVAQIRVLLQSYGYETVHGPLDWHYISKLTKQVRRENLAILFPQDRAERFAQLKERHRVITEKLTDIIDGKPTATFDKYIYPSASERIAAANTVLKWDTALFFAEEQVIAIEKAELEREPLRVRPVVLELRPQPLLQPSAARRQLPKQREPMLDNRV